MVGKLFNKLGLILILLSNILTAQQNQFTGVINNEKNQPLHWVNIVIPQLNNSAVSNEKGRFTLKNIPNGKYGVLINLLGYESILDTLIFENQSIEKGYVLTTNSYELSEVKIVVDQQSGLQTNTPYSVSSVDIKNDALVGNPSGIMGLIIQDPAVYGAEMGQGVVKPFIRGLGFSRVVTIYQGNKLENHQWGADHGLGLNDLGVSSVNIIKGPASILYGSGAVGGVILVQDDESYLLDTNFVGNVGFTYNSVSGGMRPRASLGKKFKSGFFIATDAAIENHADYVDGNNRIIGNSRYNSQTFRFHTGIKKQNFNNKLSYTYLNQNLGIINENEMDDNQSFATTRWDRTKQLPSQKINDHLISYKQNYQFKKWNTAVNISHHINNRNEIETSLDSIDLGLVQSHSYYNLRGTNYTKENWTNTFGLQGSFIQNINKKEALEILIPNSQLWENGLYYLSNLQYKKSVYQLGLRYDYRDIIAKADAQNLIDFGFILPGNPVNRRLNQHFSGFTGSIGVSTKINTKHTLKFNVATGFRAPDLAELYSNGNHPGTNRFERGNINFNREQSLQADINWLLKSKRWNLSYAVFGNLVNNYLFFAATGETVNNNLELWSFQQTNAFLYGTELDFKYDILENKVWEFNGTVNIIRGNDLKNDRSLTFIPADNFTAKIIYMPKSLPNFKSFISVRHVAQQNRLGLNETVTPQYTLLNAGIQKTITIKDKKLDIGMNGLNLLNKTFTDHLSILRAFNIPAAGRNIMINVNYIF
jgi:iron complex outermembrane receptor protein